MQVPAASGWLVQVPTLLSALEHRAFPAELRPVNWALTQLPEPAALIWNCCVQKDPKIPAACPGGAEKTWTVEAAVVGPTDMRSSME